MGKVSAEGEKFLSRTVMPSGFRAETRLGMDPRLTFIRYDLIHRFHATTERPGIGETHDDVVRRFETWAWLIGWLDEHPQASLADYRAEERRVLREGPGQHRRAA
jgi:hypothetical protein